MNIELRGVVIHRFYLGSASVRSHLNQVGGGDSASRTEPIKVYLALPWPSPHPDVMFWCIHP